MLYHLIVYSDVGLVNRFEALRPVMKITEAGKPVLAVPSPPEYSHTASGPLLVKRRELGVLVAAVAEALLTVSRLIRLCRSWRT